MDPAARDAASKAELPLELVSSSEKPVSLCEQCNNFDLQTLISSRKPWRAFQVADIVKTAEQGCTFCAFLLHNLRPTTSNDNNATLADKALSKAQNSKTLRRLVAPTLGKIQRSMDGWVVFSIPDRDNSSASAVEAGVSRIKISIERTMPGGDRDAEFIVAPGPGKHT